MVTTVAGVCNARLQDIYSEARHARYVIVLLVESCVFTLCSL